MFHTKFDKEIGKYLVVRTVNTLKVCPTCKHLTLVPTEQVVKVLSDEEVQRHLAEIADVLNKLD